MLANTPRSSRVFNISCWSNRICCLIKIPKATALDPSDGKGFHNQYFQIAPNGERASSSMPDPDSGNRDLRRRTAHRRAHTTDIASGKRLAGCLGTGQQSRRLRVGRNGTSNVYRKATNGAGEDEPIIRMSRNTFPKDSSIDGRFLLFIMDDGSGGTDLWAEPRIGGGKPYPFIVSAFNENRSAFSPRWPWVMYRIRRIRR